MNKTAIAFITLLAPGTALAGGIYVGESGSQAMERGGAFVARADDPTALSMNPAGLVKSRGVEIYLGANLLNMDLSFKRSGTYPNQPGVSPQPAYVGTAFPTMSNDATFQAVPYLAASFRFGNLGLGAGVFAPAGVPNRDFDCKVSDTLCVVNANGAPAPNRYDVVKQTALLAYPSIAAAYRVHPMLDIGARASWGFATIKARNFPWALPNNAERVDSEGDFDTDVSDKKVFSWGAGLLFRPAKFLEIGASYTSKKTIRAKGTGNAVLGPKVNPLGDPPVLIEPNPATQNGEPVAETVRRCGPGGRISALISCVNFQLPQTVSAGGRFIFRGADEREKGDVEADFRWENHANAGDDEILVNGRDTLLQNPLKPVISRHGFKDVYSVRIGGSYNIDVGRDTLSLRGGVAYDTAAAPDSWTRVDKDGRARTLLGGGLAYDLGRWRFDVGFGYVAEGSLTVKDVPNPNPTFDNRVQPDPLQPSKSATVTDWHPINAGTYTSSYVVGSVGITAAF